MARFIGMLNPDPSLMVLLCDLVLFVSGTCRRCFYTLILWTWHLKAELHGTILRLSVEYATKEVSRPSFTVKTSLLSWVTKLLVSVGNIPFH